MVSLLLLVVVLSSWMLASVSGSEEMSGGRAQLAFCVAKIEKLGYSQLEGTKRRLQDQGASWLELGSYLFALESEERDGQSSQSLQSVMVAEGLHCHHSGFLEDPSRLVVLKNVHKNQFLDCQACFRVLWKSYGYTIAEKDDAFNAIYEADEILLIPFQHNTVLAQAYSNSAEFSLEMKLRGVHEDIQEMVESINSTRWLADVTQLASWNRYTHSTDMPEVIAWLQQRFVDIGLQVELQTFMVGSTSTSNVVATLPGGSRVNEQFLIGAHFDSISGSPLVAAPGAEDNASGTASVLELARIFASHPPDVTVVFIVYSGEELGLLGSSLHAQGLVDSGNQSQLKVAHIMDMVAFKSAGSSPEVLLETSSQFSNLFGNYQIAASQYSQDLETVTSLNPFGSDHMPYITRNLPSLLIIENDWEVYPYYHTTNDLVAWLDLAFAMDVLRMNAAALALSWSEDIGTETLETSSSSYHTKSSESTLEASTASRMPGVAVQSILVAIATSRL